MLHVVYLFVTKSGISYMLCFKLSVYLSPGLALLYFILHLVHLGGGPRVVVSTAAFHARVRGSVPGYGGLKETKLFLPHPRVKLVLWGASVTER